MDYNKLMEDLISSFTNTHSAKLPRLLLHACCGPCSSAVLERLTEFFDITIYFYNPNIYPIEEYNRRKDELINFAKVFPPAKNISIIEEEYVPEDFYNYLDINNNPDFVSEAERGCRCYKCYYLRMKKTFEFAQKNGFDFVTTTLSISPYKDAKKINSIGIELEKIFSKDISPRFLYSDFKKKNGFLRSLEISKEFNLYRQDYCGCIYSLENTKKLSGDINDKK